MRNLFPLATTCVLALTLSIAAVGMDAPVTVNQICCDGGAQGSKCAYVVKNGAGTIIDQGDLKDGECITMGPAFNGTMRCACDNS